MSRFAEMAPSDRGDDPAFSPYSDDCNHPESARTEHDSGGQIARPSFYCTNCNRLVIHGVL
ncbi:hypothetical protein ACM16X_14500 [Haloarcula japonica]|uniref:hypothetical protein n=1 Tax=Haloarcula japonica TaxID=29282 RepID=UPI0039F64FE0